MEPQTWHLRHAGHVVADLVVESSDFPWLSARLLPRDGFAGLRDLFDEELRAMNEADAGDWSSEAEATWTASYNRIREKVQLVAPDGKEVPEFLLHVEGDQAWWRWSDEPFAGE